MAYDITQPRTLWEHLDNEPSELVYNATSLTHLTLASMNDKREFKGETFPEEEIEKKKALEDKVREFRDKVYEPLLAKQIDAETRYKGMSWEGEGLQVLTWVMAGRVMVTLRRFDYDVTALAAEKETPSRMGLQGINGTLNQGIALFNEAIRAGLEGSIELRADQEIGLS